MPTTLDFSFALKKGSSRVRIAERHIFEDSDVAWRVMRELNSICACEFADGAISVSSTDKNIVIDINVEWTLSREQSLIDCSDFFCILRGGDDLYAEEEREYNMVVLHWKNMEVRAHDGFISGDRICTKTISGSLTKTPVFPYRENEHATLRRSRAQARMDAHMIRDKYLVPEKPP